MTAAAANPPAHATRATHGADLRGGRCPGSAVGRAAGSPSGATPAPDSCCASPNTVIRPVPRPHL